MANLCSKISYLGIWMNPYKMQSLLYEYIIFPNLSQNWPKFTKILWQFVSSLKISPKLGPIGIQLGHFFLKKWYLYGSTFKRGHSYQNQTWVPPWGVASEISIFRDYFLLQFQALHLDLPTPWLNSSLPPCPQQKFSGVNFCL